MRRIRRKAPRFIYNPVTDRVIANNKRNRESVARQINRKFPPSSIVLISCSKQKSFENESQQLSANEAYCSTLFNKSKNWAETRGMDYGILSAKYGLLGKTDPIQDYDLTLTELSRNQRNKWAKKVRDDLMYRVNPKKVYLMAGSKYSDDLGELLEEEGIEVIEPLEGMQIGERLRYFASLEKKQVVE